MPVQWFTVLLFIYARADNGQKAIEFVRNLSYGRLLFSGLGLGADWGMV